MGVLQRFERRLEGLVEGAFAKVFGGVVQPAEVASALQREAGQNKQVMGAGRVLVPNSYVVAVGPTDLERFSEWESQLSTELGAMVSEHAAEQGWSFVDDVQVAFEPDEALETGQFRVRSQVQGQARLPPAQTAGTGRPQLVLAATATAPERVVPLTRATTVLGRGADADVRLPDTGVSRRHAQVQVQDGGVWVSDLGSTNGTLVNGRRVDSARLRDGDALEIGATTLLYRSSG